jgi:hypothetical protein
MMAAQNWIILLVSISSCDDKSNKLKIIVSAELEFIVSSYYSFQHFLADLKASKLTETCHNE